MGTSATPVFAPDYYRDFHCIADRCRHSCCIGWEIDIDDASLERFRSVEGPLGEKLRANIDLSPTPHFTLLGEAERCPFLNEKNLCELILSLGEDSICDICRDHPRFRNFYSDRTEIGLGLCCEEAARLLLLQKHPISIVELGSDTVAATAAGVDATAPSVVGGENTADVGRDTAAAADADVVVTAAEIFADSVSADASVVADVIAGESVGAVTELEQSFFTWRAELFDIVFDPHLTRSEKWLKLKGSEVPLFTSADMVRFGDFLMTLERLDPSWDLQLQRLRTTVTDAEITAFEYFMESTGRQTEYDVLLWYFLFRHLPDGLTYDPSEEEESTFDPYSDPYNNPDKDPTLDSAPGPANSQANGSANCPAKDLAQNSAPVLTQDPELHTWVLFAIAGVTTLLYLGAAHYRETGNFTLDDQVELVRMYSSEIEYSDENVEKIIEYLNY